MNMQELIVLAAENKLSDGVIHKIVAAQDLQEERERKKAFLKAMTKFQATVPLISKSSSGHNYMYASLDTVIRTIRGPLKDADLSVRFDTKADGKEITAICFVSHIDGHEEISEFRCPTPDMKSANAAQMQASANSYAKRYALMNALNLAASGDDDDGYLAGSGVLITAQEFEILEDLINTTNSSRSKLLSVFGVETLDQLPQAKFDRALGMLRTKLARQQPNAEGGEAA